MNMTMYLSLAGWMESKKSYGGITPREVFDNGTTYTFLPAEYLLADWGSTPKRPSYVILHEFLHTMEVKPGCSFDLHSIEADCVPNYQSDEKYKACMLDIILNRITGEHGSGVVPGAWSYSSTALRALRELTIPEGTAAIKDNACQYMFHLSDVTIPNSVKSIGDFAFRGTGLTEITIPDSVTSMGGSVFDRCGSLKRVTLSKNITSIPTWTFTYCSSMTDISIPADAYFHKAVSWAVEKAITSGTSAATFSPDDICTHAQIITFCGVPPVLPPFPATWL